VATNHHVIEGAREIRIKLLDGTEIDRVELLTSNAKVDLALLRVDPAELEAAPVPTVLGDSAAVEVGEAVSVIGNSLGLDHTLTNGLAFLAGAFERGEIELSMRKDKDASRRIVAAAIERYDLDPNHLRVGPPIRGREPASVRVLTP
jgi:S1-C subfamily serine protease